MLFYFINGSDRCEDIQAESLNIRLGLNRRSNSANFLIYQNTKPSGNQITKIYQGAYIDSISSDEITFTDSYELVYNTFRVGQTLTIGIGESYEYTDTVTAYDESTKTVTLSNNVDGSVSADDKVGEIIFGGVTSRVVDQNIQTLDNLIYPVTCVGYEKLFDKKTINDTFENVDARYIINSILNTDINFNKEIDSLSYADNTAIQAAWTESDDGDNPTVNSDALEGVNSGVFPWTNSSGTATYTSTITTANIAQFVGVASGLPTNGALMLWIKSSDYSVVTDITLELSDGSEDFTLSMPFDSTATDWQYTTANMATGSVTGAIDWTAITTARIVITQTGDGDVQLNGFRVNADNSFTMYNVEPTVDLDEYRAPNLRPSQILDQLSKAYEFTWYIDFQQDIHFKDKDIQVSYYDITDTSDNFYDLETELDDSQLGNRVIVEGGDKTSTTTYSQVIQGDGAVREWIMKSKFENLEIYEDDNSTTDTMEAGTNTTTVIATGHGLSEGDWIVNRTRNEAREVLTVPNPNQFTVLAVPSQTTGDTFSLFDDQKTVGVEGINDESLFDYMSNFNEKSIRASQNTDTIDSTVYLLFKYNEVIPLSIQYTDSASANALKALGLGDGIFDLDKITDKNITDTPTAITLAQAKVNEYSNPIITGSFVTNYHGFKIGDLITVNETNRAINDDYVIHKISARQRGGQFKDHIEYSISFGTTLFGAIEFFQKLLAQGDGLELNTDAVVETYITADEVCEVSDTNTIYEYAGNWKYEPSTGQLQPSRYSLASYS